MVESLVYNEYSVFTNNWLFSRELGIKRTETFNQEVSNQLNNIQISAKQNWFARMSIFAKKRSTIKYSILVGNLLLMATVVAFVAQPSSNNASDSRGILSSQVEEETISNPIDELSSADIAVNVARTVRIDEATSVANKADTVNAQLSIAPSSDVVAAQPQVVASALKSRFDIQNYTVKKGDTIESIAKEFGITTDTIRWSNDIDNDKVKPGSVLIISPVSGIIYTVQKGDTLASLASKYSTDKEKIKIFNDIEVTGMPVGEKIVIPDGRPPNQAIVPAAAPASTFGTNSAYAWGGNKAIYGGNGYDYGYCTWWASVRRAQIGSPIPSNLGNASTWKVLAAQSGLGVGNKPATGAVIWTPPRDYYGHVGFVERVNPDGSVLISEMNTVGWGVVSKKTLTAAQAAGYGYIY